MKIIFISADKHWTPYKDLMLLNHAYYREVVVPCDPTSLAFQEMMDQLGYTLV